MKSSREQFEEWFSDGINEGMKVSASGGYENLITQTAWMAWQASRAAIEIELPDKVMVEDEFDNGHNCAIDYCANAIRAAGLTVKGDA